MHVAGLNPSRICKATGLEATRRLISLSANFDLLAGGADQDPVRPQRKGRVAVGMVKGRSGRNVRCDSDDRKAPTGDGWSEDERGGRRQDPPVA